jgi:hypothetical protein
MVAATVSIAIAQTEQSAPSPAPASVIIITATPTVTLPPTATAVFTSTPTASPAPTVIITPSAESPSQSALTKLGDGSYLFSDTRAGYEVKLPANWTVMRIREKEFTDALNSVETTSNPHMQQALLGVQNEDPYILRLFAVDAQPAHIQNEFISDMRFTLDAGKNINLNSDVDLQAIAAKIPTSATVFRFEVTSVKLFNSAAGVQFGVIESQSSFTNNAGVDVPLYQKQVFFNTKGGIQSITLTTLANLKDTLLPVFDAIMETVNLVVKVG